MGRPKGIRIDPSDIVGMLIGRWYIRRYLGFTTDHCDTSNRDHIRHWYECTCMSCRRKYKVRRDSLIGCTSYMCSHCSKGSNSSHDLLE